MLASTLRRRLISRATTTNLGKSTRRHQLTIDSLERRDCPASSVVSSLSGSTLMVEGTEGGDEITVKQNGSWLSTSKKQNGVWTVVGNTYHESVVTSISIRGLGGNDILRNDTNKNSRITGDGGSDTIFGGNGTDQIYGGTNNDSLYGGNGADDLYGEGGGDRLYGASGYDGYETGNTNDTLQGGDGPDSMYGGYGSDVLVGGNDNDWIQGQWGDDMIAGANWNFSTSRPSSYEIATASNLSTNDTLFGENGNDQIYGGEGNDDLSGGFDSDDMYGENGNDRMWGAFWDSTTERPGGVNSDSLWGGNGSDQLFGGEGVDHLVGGNSNDYLEGQSGNDVLWGANGVDPNETGNPNDTLKGGDGSDWIYGGIGDDGLYGEGGSDALEGNAGNDVLDGGTDNDNLVGSEGSDWLFGGDGHDSLWGAAWQNNYAYADGSNFLFGDDGDDALFGGNGYDYLDGGFGKDGLFGGANDTADSLNGGPDADRFLMPADLGADGMPVGEDSTPDLADEDAQPIFLDGFATTYVASPTQTLNYTAKNWSNADIVRADAALAVLHHEGPGTRLLETNGGGDLIIVRHGTGNRGYNDGWIHMTDANEQFGGTDTSLRGYLLHEIGHGWQGDSFQAGGTDYWEQFVAISEWTDSNPDDSDFTKSTNEGRGDRWYRTNAGYASDYAKTNANEDFAESFAAYFTQRAGWTFYNGAGSAAISAKLNVFTAWLGDL